MEFKRRVALLLLPYGRFEPKADLNTPRTHAGSWASGHDASVILGWSFTGSFDQESMRSRFDRLELRNCGWNDMGLFDDDGTRPA